MMVDIVWDSSRWKPKQEQHETKYVKTQLKLAEEKLIDQVV